MGINLSAQTCRKIVTGSGVTDQTALRFEGDAAAAAAPFAWAKISCRILRTCGGYTQEFKIPGIKNAMIFYFSREP